MNLVEFLRSQNETANEVERLRRIEAAAIRVAQALVAVLPEGALASVSPETTKITDSLPCCGSESGVHLIGCMSDDALRGRIHRSEESGCGCWNCVDELTRITVFIVCENCGNKRCPHATDHRLECTDSNEPGQPGSRFSVPKGGR